MEHILQVVAFPLVFGLEQREEIKEERVVYVNTERFNTCSNDNPEEDVVNDLQMWPGGCWVANKIVVLW